MTRPTQIATLLLRSALVMLLLVQAAHAGATALRMELIRTGGGEGLIVICTPNGPKTIALSDVLPQTPESSFECECPSATQCGSSALAGPGSAAELDGRALWPTNIEGYENASGATCARVSMHPGSPRSPPAHSL